VVLVGFKLEHTNDKDYLLKRAYQRMEEWRADYVICNSSDSLHTNDTRHYIVSKSGRLIEANNKKETAEMLVNTLHDYFSDKRNGIGCVE
jgi:hypothetical protein